MENQKTCSCFGHTRVEITEELRTQTKIEIENAIADGVRTFLFGGKSDFDDLVYDLVSEIKSQQPELGIKRVFCFPLINDLRKHPRWFIKKEYEALECPEKSFDYWFTSLYYRNIAMIDRSDIVLFYAMERAESGAYKAYRYAVKKHKKIINLAMMT